MRPGRCGLGGASDLMEGLDGGLDGIYRGSQGKGVNRLA